MTNTYITYKSDGSIKKITLDGTQFINQGNDGVDKIHAKIDGLSVNDYTCVALFELPDGSTSELSGVVSNDEYVVTLTQAQTMYAGVLKMSLVLQNLNTNALYTYRMTFQVNPTVHDLDTTMITQAQYLSLVSTLNQYQLKDESGVVLTSSTFTPEQFFNVSYEIYILSDTLCFFHIHGETNSNFYQGSTLGTFDEFKPNHSQHFMCAGYSSDSKFPLNLLIDENGKLKTMAQTIEGSETVDFSGFFIGSRK